ncbi:MAG: SRPBCC family protein [Verrucomicrobiota bacterium]
MSHTPLENSEPINGVHLEGKVTIHCPVEKVYAYWRDFKNLPTFMDLLVSVEEKEAGVWNWVIKGPLDVRLAWDSVILDEKVNELITWKTVGKADVKSAGTVRFTSLDEGKQTEVKLTTSYDPPGGPLGPVIAALLMSAPEDRLKEDLMRLKRLMEE